MNEERFGSLARVYGAEELQKIQNANICVVGLGGVGSWVVEALARTGVQHLTLIDGDDISRSNINRQCHALESTIGQMKAKVMQQRVLDINPECDCRIIEQYINDENVSALLTPDPVTSDLKQSDSTLSESKLSESKPKFDCVIDAIDRIKYKSLMIHFCKKNKIKIIATGGAGGLTDPTQIEIKDLSRTWNDPLASAVRLALRQVHNFSRNLKRSFGVPCVYSTEQQRYPDKDGNIGYQKPGVANLTLDCGFGYGSSVMVTSTFGFVAAARAIEIVLKKSNKS